MAKVQPLCSYVLALLRNFIKRLANHENSLMREVFNSKSGVNWKNTLYLSPVGVLLKKFNSFDNVVEYRPPEFNSQSHHGSNSYIYTDT